MPELRLPLSGDVNQSINPLSIFLQAMGSQLGLININLGRSSDPELEQRIVNEVGTYGKQLGTIGDVLRILIKHIKPHDLEPHERRAVTALEYQLDEIDRLKSKQEKTLARRQP